MKRHGTLAEVLNMHGKRHGNLAPKQIGHQRIYHINCVTVFAMASCQPSVALYIDTRGGVRCRTQPPFGASTDSLHVCRSLSWQHVALLHLQILVSRCLSSVVSD